MTKTSAQDKLLAVPHREISRYEVRSSMGLEGVFDERADALGYAEELRANGALRVTVRPDQSGSSLGESKSRAQVKREVDEMFSEHPSSSNKVAAVARRGDYPFDLIPGDVVERRDIRGRKKYRVSHLGHSGSFVQVYTREVGGGGGIVTFDRSQLRLSR